MYAGCCHKTCCCRCLGIDEWLLIFGDLPEGLRFVDKAIRAEHNSNGHTSAGLRLEAQLRGTSAGGVQALAGSATAFAPIGTKCASKVQVSPWDVGNKFPKVVICCGARRLPGRQTPHSLTRTVTCRGGTLRHWPQDDGAPVA